LLSDELIAAITDITMLAADDFAITRCHYAAITPLMRHA